MRFAKICNQKICTKRANSAITTFALGANLRKVHIYNIFAQGKFYASEIHATKAADRLCIITCDSQRKQYRE